MVKEKITDAKFAVRGHRSKIDNTQIYVFESGPKQNQFAGNIKDENIVSYDGHRYALTDKQYEYYKP